MTAVVGLPLDVDQVIYQRATWQVQYRWVIEDVGVDFTGWSARAQLRRRAGAPVLLDLSTGNGGVTLGPDGLITLSATATQTAALTADGVYDLVLTGPDQTVTRFLQGAIDVVPAVTEP